MTFKIVPATSAAGRHLSRHPYIPYQSFMQRSIFLSSAHIILMHQLAPLQRLGIQPGAQPLFLPLHCARMRSMTMPFEVDGSSTSPYPSAAILPRPLLAASALPHLLHAPRRQEIVEPSVLQRVWWTMRSRTTCSSTWRRHGLFRSLGVGLHSQQADSMASSLLFRRSACAAPSAPSHCHFGLGGRQLVLDERLQFVGQQLEVLGLSARSGPDHSLPRPAVGLFA